MNLKEYIAEGRYDLEARKELFLSDPVKLIMDSDDLPFDDIMAIEGKLQKVVFVEDDRAVGIADLLSYEKEEDIPEGDVGLREVWRAYMDNVSVEEAGFQQILELIRRGKNN